MILESKRRKSFVTRIFALKTKLRRKFLANLGNSYLKNRKKKKEETCDVRIINLVRFNCPTFFSLDVSLFIIVELRKQKKKGEKKKANFS